MPRRAGKAHPMLTVAPDPPAGDDRPADGSSSLIDEIVREGARRMLAGALQAEMEAAAEISAVLMGFGQIWA